MGHERIGFLPRTKQLQSIVNQLTQFSDGDVTVIQVINDTLDATKKAYEKMPYDESII